MFRKQRAYFRYDGLTATSYRFRLLLSLGGLAIGVVPLYFIANALQPLMGSKIAGQGEQYFSFVLVGLAVQQFVIATTDALPRTINDGIRAGTVETLFATPTSVPTLLSGMMSFRIFWAFLQSLVLLAGGLLLGARFDASGILPAVFMLVLIVVSYVPFGLMASALVVSFRTMGPISTVVGTGSVLLGGVYYPTEVIPSWIEHISAVVPLTYGLRALRKTFLEGLPLEAAAGDVAVLLVFTLILFLVSGFLFQLSLRHARRSGTLAQY